MNNQLPPANIVTSFKHLSYNRNNLFRVSVEIARGTPHGRDRDRWGTSSNRRGGSPRRDSRDSRDSRSKPVWLDKYGPPTRTDYKIIVENLSSRVSWQVSL